MHNISYGEIIEDKAWYSVEWICATTYSLDRAVLMPLIGYMQDYYERSSLHEAICSAEDRLRVFYQYNKLSYTPIKETYAGVYECLCMKALKPINPQKLDSGEASCFHPKIVLIAYQSLEKEAEYILRLAVMSRNLTRSEFDEVVSVVEVNCKEKVTLPENIEAVNELLKKYFENESIVFQPYNKIIEKMHLEDIEKVVAVSPGFEDNSLLNNNEMFQTTTYYKNNSHAKIYHITRKNQTKEVWVGSANCTAAGLGDKGKNNYECMIKHTVTISFEEFIQHLKETGYSCVDEDRPNYKEEDTNEGKEPLVESFLNRAGNIQIQIRKTEEEKYKVRVHFENEGNIQKEESIQMSLCGRVLSDFKSEISVSKDQLSMEVWFRAIIDRKFVKRMVFAQYKDEETREIMEDIYREYKEDIPLIEKILPYVHSRNGKETQESQGAYNTSLINQRDNEYEKLMKLYAMDYDLMKLKRYLQHIKERHISPQKVEEVLEMIDILVGGNHSDN